MLFRKIMIALLALSLSAALASCGNKDKGSDCTHRDADDNGKCDSCSASFEDGDEEKELTKKTFTFVVKEVGGETLSGVSLTLKAGQYTVNITSDASGKAAAELYPANYSIEYNRPENETDYGFNFQLETVSLDLTKGASFEIVMVDNTPDGSSDKPFFISEQTAITLAPGEEIFYQCRGSVESWLEILGSDISLTYNGNVLTPENGLIKLNFVREEGAPVTATYDKFSIKNNGSATFESFIEFKFLPGTSGNPYPVTSNSFAVNSAASNVYYKYVAVSDGVLVATSTSSSCVVTLTNESVVSGETSEAGAAYISVKAGDEVMILAKGSAATVNLVTYAANAENPVPVSGNNLSISIPAGGSVSFAIEGGRYLMITDEDSIAVICGDDSYNPDADGEIFFKVSGTGSQVVTIVNGLDTANNINIQLQ